MSDVADTYAEALSNAEEEVPRPRRRAPRSAPRREGPAAAPSPETPREEAPKPPPRRPTAPKGRSREEKLKEFFGSLSLIPGVVGDKHCADILAQRTPAMAEAWADLAKQNPSVARVIDKMLEGSAWGGVVLSTLAVAIPIAGHHGLWPGPDPFAIFYPPPEGTPPSPIIVPPAPSQNAPSPTVPPSEGEGATPHPAPADQPPGVVTVAGSTNGAPLPPFS